MGHPLKKSQDDTLSKRMLDSLSVQMESVGTLVAPAHGVGTVFRVGSKYLMTAQHVVRDIVDHDGLIKDNSIYVTFHESALHPERQVYQLERVVLADDVLDFAILELANSGNVIPSKMQLSKDDINMLETRDVSFIGYGHPDKSGKHLDPRCKLIPPESERFVNARKWLNDKGEYLKKALKQIGRDPEIINKGYAGYNDKYKILFDCYMQQGASGSPALTYNNQRQEVKVVGILTHGLPEFYFLLPQLVQVNVDNKYRFEVGSRMSSIYEFILNRNKDLAHDLFE